MVSQAAGCFSNTAVGAFHEGIQQTFSPLPQKGKVIEVIKRIAMVILAPLAYVVLGLVSLVGRVFSSPTSRHDGVYFVRYLNIPTKTPGIGDLANAINEDLTDHNKGYQKGACLYTPSSIQPLAVFDPRHAAGTQIAVEYPFAVLIDPKVELHYWSLNDMDRNMSRQDHENAKGTGAKKYKPTSFHSLFAQWKTIHFTGVDSFISKVETVAQAAKDQKKCYTTAGGKQKMLADLKGEHNEGSISYNPEKNIVGFLIRNTPQDIQLATQFKSSFKDSSGTLVLKDAFLAYQDAEGKIVKI